MTGPIRVRLADEHAPVRQTLAERLPRESDIEVAELLATADQVVTESTRLKPDGVVLDMSGASCFEAARRRGFVLDRDMGHVARVSRYV